MTTLISWLGSDSRGPASIYIAADSRISFGRTDTWDNARKTFASQKYPELFAYCGDAFFPSQILSQAVELLDRGLLFDVSETAECKAKELSDFIGNALQSYTARNSLRFDLAYACRASEGILCEFALYHMSYIDGAWASIIPIMMPQKSGIVLNLGSGSSSIREHISRWSGSAIGGTSRSVYSAFCDSLISNTDRSSGGPPQLVGIYRKNSAHVFGTIHSEQKYIIGTIPVSLKRISSLEWRKSLFERCDPATGKRLAEAQPQPRPQGV